MSGPGKWIHGKWMPAVEFVEIARTVNVTEGPPRITYEGQSTFWKFCTVCHYEMPHVRKDDYSECAVCGNKSYKKKEG